LGTGVTGDLRYDVGATDLMFVNTPFPQKWIINPDKSIALKGTNFVLGV